MRKFVVLILSSLIAFQCSDQSSKQAHADTSSAPKTDARQVKELIFDTVINQYILLSNQEHIKQKIDSLIFCKRPEIDFEKEYILADTNTGEYLCLSQNQLHPDNQISMITIGKLRLLNSSCKINYTQLPELISGDSVYLGMSREQVISRYGIPFVSSACDTCRYISSLYYSYSEKQFPIIAKRYNFPNYSKEFLFDGQGKLVCYRFGFSHP